MVSGVSHLVVFFAVCVDCRSYVSFYVPMSSTLESDELDHSYWAQAVWSWFCGEATQLEQVLPLICRFPSCISQALFKPYSTPLDAYISAIIVAASNLCRAFTLPICDPSFHQSFPCPPHRDLVSA